MDTETLADTGLHMHKSPSTQRHIDLPGRDVPKGLLYLQFGFWLRMGRSLTRLQ